MNIVRILLSVAAMFNWFLQQFDVKHAFLHGDLEEEVFMELLPSFNMTFGPNMKLVTKVLIQNCSGLLLASYIYLLMQICS